MPGALDAAFRKAAEAVVKELGTGLDVEIDYVREVSGDCLLYTSPSPRDRTRSRMPSSA